MKNYILFLTVLLLLSLTQCKKDCTEVGKCKLNPDTGACLAAFERYYYDKGEKKCKVFVWGGCGGVVPFNTLQECEKACHCD
jgi:hypothetical protein